MIDKHFHLPTEIHLQKMLLNSKSIECKQISQLRVLRFFTLDCFSDNSKVFNGTDKTVLRSGKKYPKSVKPEADILSHLIQLIGIF